MSSPTTPRPSAAAADPESTKLNGVKEPTATSSSFPQNMFTMTGSKRKAASPTPTSAKVSRVAPDSAAPALHGEDRGATIEKVGSDTDSETPEKQEPQEHTTRRTHLLKRAAHIPTPDHHASQPVSAESKDTVVPDAGADSRTSAEITSEVASEKASSVSPSESKEEVTGEVKDTPSISAKLEANLAASVDGAPLPMPDINEDTASSSPPRKRRVPKHSLFMKKTKRVQKSISQPAPKSLHKDRVEVNIIAAEDAIVEEKEGIVAAKAQRGKQGNAAYFAKAPGGVGPTSSSRLRQTYDGELKFQKKL